MKKYDLIVLGGGSAGLVAAKLAIGLGKSILLIEKRAPGGDCTWYGCIPSKTLLKSAGIAENIKNSSKYGINGEFFIAEGALERFQAIRDNVHSGETPEVLRKEGIDVEIGSPVFENKNSIKLNGKIYSGRKFLISTGSHAFVPPIDGIDKIDYLTNENIFELNKLPESIVILGAGPIGTELSFALNRLGVKTALVERGSRILPNDDEDLTRILYKKMESEGISFYLNTDLKRLRPDKNRLYFELSNSNNNFEISAEKFLIAVGRKPSISELQLEKAGVNYDKSGIFVNKYLQTDNKNIYAAGDVVAPYKFTHLAENHGIVAVKNMFLPLKNKINYKTLGWCTYTEPELAKVGLSEKQAKEAYGDNFLKFSFPFDRLDRAVTDGTNTGLAKIFTDKSYKIIGATILSERAGEIIAALQVAMVSKIPLYKLEKIIYTYPTYSQCLKYLTRDAYLHKINNNIFVKLIKKLKSDNIQI